MAKKNISKKQKSIPTPKRVKSNLPDLIISKDFWKQNRIPAFLLFIFPFILYFQSINYEYVLDDKIVYTQNSFVKKGMSGLGDIFGKESMVGYLGAQKDYLEGGRYRPLSFATFAIEHEFFGNNSYKVNDYWTKEMNRNATIAPSINKIKDDFSINEVRFEDEESFLQALSTKLPNAQIERNKEEILFHAAYSNSKVSHFINILLYALVVLLLFRVLSIMFPPEQSKWYMTLPFVAALLFMLHPIHVEVVANVKGRDEILALMGALSAMYFTLKYIEKENIIYLVLSGVTFLLGALAKEHVITFIAVIPLMTYFFTKSSFQKNGITVIPLVIATLVFLYMRKEAVGADHLFDFSSGKASADLMNNPFAEMNVSERFATVFYTLGVYVKLLFIPHPLTHDYYPYQIPIMNWGNMGSIFSFLLYAAMGVYALWGLMKKNIVAFGILFFLLPLFPVSNLLISVGTFMNDRFIFISSVGFCIIVAYWISRKLPAPVLNMSLFVILLLGYSAKTFTRVPDWKDAFALNSAAVKYSPNSARANLFMSTALFKNFYKHETDPQRKADYLNEIEDYVKKSLSIHPRYGSALTMQVIVSVEKYKRGGSILQLYEEFKQVIYVKREDANIYKYLEHLGRMDVKAIAEFCHHIGYETFIQRSPDPQLALKYINIGLKFAPNDPVLLRDLAEIRQML